MQEDGVEFEEAQYKVECSPGGKTHNRPLRNRMSLASLWGKILNS